MMKTLLTMLMCVVGCSLFAHPIYVREANVDGSLKAEVVEEVGATYATGDGFELRFTLEVPADAVMPQGRDLSIFALCEEVTYGSGDYGAFFVNRTLPGPLPHSPCFAGTINGDSWISPTSVDQVFRIEAGKSYTFMVSYNVFNNMITTQAVVDGLPRIYNLPPKAATWGRPPANFTIRLGDLGLTSSPPISGAIYKDIAFEIPKGGHLVYVNETDLEGNLKDEVVKEVGATYVAGNDFELRFILDVPVDAVIPPNSHLPIFALCDGATYGSGDYGAFFVNAVIAALPHSPCFAATINGDSWISPTSVDQVFRIEADKSYTFMVSYNASDNMITTQAVVDGLPRIYNLPPRVATWGRPPADFTIRLGNLDTTSLPIPGAVYRDLIFKTSLPEATHSGTINSSSVNWSDINWGDGNTAPTSATDTVVLSWAEGVTGDALALHFDEELTSGAITFNTMKSLTLTKITTATATVSVASYVFRSSLDTPMIFGAGYSTLPRCIGGRITLAAPQTAVVRSVANKTTTYIGGTANTVPFQPCYGGVINLTGGTYSFNEVDGSATQTQLMMGGTDDANRVTLDVGEVFGLGATTATINEYTTITTHALHLTDQMHDSSMTLTQNGGVLRVTGDSSENNVNADIMIGKWRSDATYTLNGGTFEAPNAAITMGFDGGSRKYLLDIAGPTAIAKAKGFLLQTSGSSASTRNTLKIRNGGTFEVGDLGINVNGLVLDFSMDGGTLGASADYASNAPLVVGEGGATVDTDSSTTTGEVTTTEPHRITFNRPVSGEGALTVTGTGTLAWNTPQMPAKIHVASGTLAIGTPTLDMRGASQEITIVAGATITLPEVFTIDLAGRVMGESLTLMTGVTDLSTKAITIIGLDVPCVLDPTAASNGIMTLVENTDILTWSASLANGNWQVGATDPNPWQGGVNFANGADVLLGAVEGNVANVSIIGSLTVGNLFVNSIDTVYTVTGDNVNNVTINRGLTIQSGQVTWDAPFNHTGVFAIATGATFAVNATHPTKAFTFPSNLMNNGTFAIDSIDPTAANPDGWTLPESVTTTGAGVIEIRSGTVTSHAPQKPGGTFKITAGATLVLTASVASSTLTTITGTGTLRILATTRELQGPTYLSFNISNFDGQVEVIKTDVDTMRMYPSCFTYDADADLTPEVKPTFSFGDGTQLYGAWEFDTTIVGIGYDEGGGKTLGVIRNESGSTFAGAITLAGDATITSGGTYLSIVSGVSDSLPPTLTIGTTYSDGNYGKTSTLISGAVATSANPINLRVHHRTTTLTGTGYYDTLGLTADASGISDAASATAALVINGATSVKALALTKGTITVGANGTLTSGGMSSPIIVDLGSRDDFAEGDTIIDWSAAETKPDATFELKAGSKYVRLESSDTGLTVTNGVGVTFTGTDTDTFVSENAEAYISSMAKLKTPQGTTITHVQISRSDTNKAYLLNVIPSFVQGQGSESSILVATLNCSFRVTDLQIVGTGANATITATATITVSNGTEKYAGVDAGIKGTLKLVSGETLDAIMTPVTAISTDPSKLIVEGTFVEGNPFYKVIVVETPDTPETPVE